MSCLNVKITFEKIDCAEGTNMRLVSFASREEIVVAFADKLINFFHDILWVLMVYLFSIEAYNLKRRALLLLAMPIGTSLAYFGFLL